MTDLKKILGEELDRCADYLKHYEPGTENYRLTLQHISDLLWMTAEEEERHGLDVGGAPAPVAPTAPPTVTEPEPEPAPAPEKDSGNGVDVEKYKLELKARLGDSRNKGVNTKELLSAVGHAKYSSIEDYATLKQLSDLLDKALAEKENA